MVDITQNTPGALNEQSANLAYMIHLMHTTGDAAQRDQLTQQLNELQKDPLNHIRAVAELLCSDLTADPTFNEKKMSLAIYLKQFAQKLTAQADKQVSKINMTSYTNDTAQMQEVLASSLEGFTALQTVTDIFVKCCLSNFCELKFKAQLIAVIHKQLVVFQKLRQHNEKPYQTCMAAFVPEIMKALQQADCKETLTGAISLCEKIFEVIDKNAFEQIFSTMANQLRGAADLQIAGFKQDIQSAQNQVPVAPNDPVAMRLTSQLDVLQAWTSMFTRMIEVFESRSFDNFDVLIRSEDLASVLLALIALTANKGSAHHQNSIISFSGLQKLDQQLNMIKNRALEALNMLIDYALQHNEGVQAQSPIVNKTIACTPHLIMSARCFATDPNLEDLLDEEVYSELIVQLLDTLSITSGERKFHDAYMAEMKNIVVQICFNLIKFTRSEAIRMKDDPQEYINFSLDCCDKQQSMVPKTQACKLIESLCDNIDGAVTFITNFTCSALILAVQGAGAEVPDPSIAQWQQETFFQSDPVLIADTSMIVLTLMSYILPQRKDLIGTFETVISSNVSAFLEKKPHNLPEMDDFQNAKAVLLLNRFSLLLGYYADILFTKNQEAFKQTMEFLIEAIGHTEGIDEVVARGCVDTIAIIVTDQDVSPRLKLYIEYIVQQLVFLLDSVTFVNFYDFMNDFVKLFAKDLVGTPIMSLFQATIARILQEQQAKENGTQKDQSSIVLDKCCTILRICVDNNTYMGQMQDQFEEALKPIFRYMGEPKKISFEDEILIILRTMIKKRKAVTPIMWEIFDLFPALMTKSKGQLGDLLDAINNYMLYGKEQFALRESSITVYAQIVEQGMFTKKIMQDCEGAVACQLLFQSLVGTQSLNAFIERLLDLTVRRMKEDQVPLVLKKHLLGIFMAAMYYNSAQTLQYLEHHNMTSQLVEELVSLSERFTAEYEKRFFNIGICKMLMSPTLPQALQPHLLALLNSLVSQITSLHEQVTRKITAQSKKEASIDEDDSNEDDSDDDDDDDDDEIDTRKKSKKAMNDEEEETKDGGAMNDDQLGFTSKAKNDDEDDDSDDAIALGNITDDDDDDEDQEEFSFFDLKIVMEYLQCPMKKEDETKVFKETLQSLSARSPAEMKNLLQQMSDVNQKNVRKLLTSATVKYSDESGSEQSVARRIVRVVRNRPAAGQAPAQQ